jgi:PAS domain S-box-containing protein
MLPALARFRSTVEQLKDFFIMNSLIQRFSVIAGFTLLTALLIGNTIVIRRQFGVQVANQESVTHSRVVRLAIARTQSLLDDAETGQRGYLYTGDMTYLAPYNNAVATIDQHIQDLARLTADDPHQQQHIASVRELANLKLQELADTIALYQAGKADQARSVVLSNRGLMLMEDFRREIGEMQQEELAIESSRDGEYQRSVRITVACIYLATALAALGLLLLANFILRERKVREQHARELQQREELFRVTLTSIGDAVIATDAKGTVTFLNPIAESLTGAAFAEAAGKDIGEIFPIFNEFTGEPAENPVTKVMHLGVVVGLANHTALKHRDGHAIPIEDSAAPIRDDRGVTVGVVLVFHDVTADRKSQEVLRKTERLATAARFSATVAHEINNPLAAVVNLIYIAKTMPDSSAALKEILSQAEQELERVAHITRQTLGFYRDSKQPEAIDLAPVIDSVIKLFSNKISAKNIQIDSNVNDCPPIWGLSGELKQVISNLLSNALDAVARDGKISIHCRGIDTEQGPAVELVIEDDGPGVAQEHVERIFDPFFTTKEDVGTGLGLWVTREIVDRHGGNIQLRSEKTDTSLPGAAFVIHLPCVRRDSPRDHAALH